MADLYVALRPRLEEVAAARAAASQEAAAQDVSGGELPAAEGSKAISLTLMGLPNVVSLHCCQTPHHELQCREGLDV